jgi:hypothetical protein
LVFNGATVDRRIINMRFVRDGPAGSRFGFDERVLQPGLAMAWLDELV